MTQPPQRFFDPERIVQVLGRHRVRYVLVGGLAATLHGSPAVTYDVEMSAASRSSSPLSTTSSPPREAAGRDRDRAQLPALYALRDELGRR